MKIFHDCRTRLWEQQGMQMGKTCFFFQDEPLGEDDDLKYTRWSKCSQKSNNMRTRYLKCVDRKDIRKCPKETKPCGC